MEQEPFWRSTMFQRLINATLVLVAVFLVVAVFSAIKEYRFIGSTPGAHTISVSGEGEVFAVPDIATFTFSVVEEEDTVADAQARAAEKINGIIAYLKNEGVKEDDIKTTSYNVFPQYDYVQPGCTEFRCPPGERVFRAFEVRQTIRVKVRDTEQAGTLLSGVGEREVSDVSGLSFTFEDDSVLNEEARALAIEDAKSKAEKLADELDVRLVRVVNFHESSPGPYREAFGLGGEAATAVAESSPVPEVPSGENKILSRVTIVYEIR